MTTTGSQSVSSSTVNSVLSLGDMRTYLTPRVTFAPGAMVEALAFRGAFAQPAHDATIDLADDGVVDWQFSSSPAYGSYGWQTRIDTTSVEHSMSVTGSGTMSVLIPQNANIHTLLIGLNPSGDTDPLTVGSGQKFVLPNPNIQLDHYSSLNCKSTIIILGHPYRFFR